MTPFRGEPAYPEANDRAVPWWWAENRDDLRLRQEEILEQREVFKLETVDHGQVVKYLGDRPVETAKNLKYTPFYGEDDIPTGQNLTHHLRKSSRESVMCMFREANEQLFEIAARHDYFPEDAEVAIDITDWPFYGDSESNEFIRGTKPGRNHSRAWKYITLALVGTDTPLILVVLPVRDKSKAPKYIGRMLRLSRQHVNISRVYLDAETEFYDSDTISTITEQGWSW